MHSKLDNVLTWFTGLLGVGGTLVADIVQSNPWAPLLGAILTVLAMYYRDKKDERNNKALRLEIERLRGKLESDKPSPYDLANPSDN